MVEVDIPCAASLKEPWSLMLVDTPGFDATPHQSLVESIKLGVKSSPAYVYCVEFGKIQSKTSQEHYGFLQEKCKGICKSSVWFVCHPQCVATKLASIDPMPNTMLVLLH